MQWQLIINNRSNNITGHRVEEHGRKWTIVKLENRILSMFVSLSINVYNVVAL